MHQKKHDPWSPLSDPAWAARDQVIRARHVLDELGDIHEARKSLKRARALVRICTGGFSSPEDARQLRRRLRDSGRLLSESRDREAAQEVLESLGPLASPGTAAEEGPHRGEVDGVIAEVIAELDDVARTLRGIRGEVARVDALEGVAKAYRRARRAYRDVVESATGEAIHTLRKRTKDLRYQLDWLAPVWPRVLGSWVEELHALTDDLGRAQDIRIYRTAVRDVSSSQARRRHARNLWTLRHEGRRARRSALSRGRKLFLETPGGFGERIMRLGEG